MHTSSKLLNREDMIAMFKAIGEIAAARDTTYEIAIYGGSALMLSFDYRQSTQDIDFETVSYSSPSAKPIACLDDASKQVIDIADVAAANIGLPKGILRDDVSIFVSDTAKYHLFGEYGSLRVLQAAPEYILSMKVMSMRSSFETQDMRDIWELIDACEIKTLAQLLKLFESFYPDHELPLRNKLLLEDVFEAKQNGEPYSAALGW